MQWTSTSAYTIQHLDNCSGVVTNVTLMAGTKGDELAVQWWQDAHGLILAPIQALPSGVQANLAVGLRVHFGGATVDEIDEPTREMRARISR